MRYRYDKYEIKQMLTIDQVFDLVADLGGEPRLEGGESFVSKTICHNRVGEGTFKLYYYDNSKLFKCYTECGDTFDIYGLLLKINPDWDLNRAILYVADYFGIAVNIQEAFPLPSLEDWEVINEYNKKLPKIKISSPSVEEYDKNILKYLPRPRIKGWEEEGISADVIFHRGICYDPVDNCIIIPHYDKDSHLIGIRTRTLIEEKEKYGKYKPAYLNHTLYSHPLGFSLYNLNNSKDNIKLMGKAIVFESEKSCLKYATYFGEDNDLSVAVCGSNISKKQIQLLLDLEVKEIIIGFDKQFKELGDEECLKWIKKLEMIHNKYQAFCQFSYLFDKENLLNYKMSPIDNGKEIFLTLFKERVII